MGKIKEKYIERINKVRGEHPEIYFMELFRDVFYSAWKETDECLNSYINELLEDENENKKD